MKVSMTRRQQFFFHWKEETFFLQKNIL